MKKIFAMCLAGIVLILSACSAMGDQKFTKVDTAMGTVVTMTIYARDGKESAEEVLSEIKELEETVLSKRIDTSEIGRVNAGAGNAEGVIVSDFCGDLLLECLALTLDSENAFDTTLGTLVTLWNIDALSAESVVQTAIPTKEEIADALEHSGIWNVKLTKAEEGYRVYLKEGCSLDLGSVGKGMALDVVRNYLESQEDVTAATVSVGGSVLVYGEKPDQTSWKVGIVDPFNTGEPLGTLTVPSGYCVSTSGDYERYIEVDGKKYHHLLDGKTGYPAESGVRSVTILCKSGWQSDAFSTACFCLGAEKGIALANSHEVEALFVLEDGSVVMTEGMEAYFAPSK